MTDFLLTEAGTTISGFNAATDKIVINLEDADSKETLTNFDLVNNLAVRLNGALKEGTQNYRSPMTATSTGVEIQIPDFDTVGTISFVKIATPNLASAQALVGQLADNPELFEIHSKGNTVVEWNDITLDSLRLANVPPAASTRYFALVHTAIYDAVQGILEATGTDNDRRTYLESQGIKLPTVAGLTAESADVAAAAAAKQVLENLFTDPNNPAIFGADGTPIAFTPAGGSPSTIAAYFPEVFSQALNAAVNQSADEGVSNAAIAAGMEYGEAIADAILALRETDGYLLNADGTKVDLVALNAEYRNGIENTGGKGDAGSEDDGTVGVLSDGTTLIGDGDPISTLKKDGTPGISSTDPTTPGAWRRAEDTLNPDTGQFGGLASPEVASINQTWFLPRPNFFNNKVNPPPTLDSDNYIANVEEVKAEGSLLDLPISGNVSLNNRSITVDGVTSIAPNSNLGPATNDTDPSDANYPGAVGPDAPDNVSSTLPDGIGTTSAERTVIAHVFANAEGGYGPNYAYQKVAQQLAIERDTSLADSAYIFESLNLALADGFANIWDMKWDEDYFWRPVSSIRNADQLGQTSLDDNNWTPREPTPQHPCHPSGTSLTAGISGTILAHFFGEESTFTVSADIHPVSARLANALTDTDGDGLTDVEGTPLEEVSLTFTNFSDAIDVTRLSRIYAGAHFRFATEHGVQLGDLVADYFLNNNPLEEPITITGDAKANTLIGDSEKELILGLAGNDRLFGEGNRDVLKGGDGKDLLNGGTGSDILNGGTGKDRFVFGSDSVFSKTLGVDRVVDFTKGEDKIALDRTTFAELDKPLSFASVSGGAVATNSALITYVSATGSLYYNENGTDPGFGNGGRFADFANGLDLTRKDFVLVP